MSAEPARIIANGSETRVQLPCTVAGFLADRGWKPTQVVVEHNGNVLAKNEMTTQPLRDGDRLEIVVPVAGG